MGNYGHEAVVEQVCCLLCQLVFEDLASGMLDV